LLWLYFFFVRLRDGDFSGRVEVEYDQLYLSLNEVGLMFKGHTVLAQEEVDYILLETFENGTTHSVDVNTFETLFGDVKGKPTYEALSGTHTFKLEDTKYTMTAEEMGYQKYFDQWKEQGLLKS
jgi:lipopolysaccharide assembly outer membrane protein LptD (OstA)